VTLNRNFSAAAKPLIAGPGNGADAIRYASASSTLAKPMTPIISVANLSKTYASGLSAVRNVSLEIRRGEIFALLGPNGAGKTTLISIICGIVNPSQGTVTVDGHDIVNDYRAARSMIGLVPQELTTDAFETPWARCRSAAGFSARRPIRRTSRRF